MFCVVQCRVFQRPGIVRIYCISNGKTNKVSIVFYALVDATNYNSVGCDDRVAVRGVFKNSTLFLALENNSVFTIPKTNFRKSPDMIVADDAFPFKQ